MYEFKTKIKINGNKKNQKKILDHLLNKYKKDIIVGEKNYVELIKYLGSEFLLKEKNIDDIAPSILGHMIYNILKSQSNRSVNELECMKRPEQFIKSGQFSFIAYDFPKSIENCVFYNQYELQNENEEIYIIFETNTNAFFTPCTKLCEKLYIVKGVSQYDLNNKTIALLNYLFNIDFYVKGMY